MKAILTLITGLLTCICANAQLIQTARTRVPFTSEFSTFQVWPQTDSSILLLSSEPAFRRCETPFILSRFDSNLNLQWQTPLDIPKNSTFIRAAFDKQTAYLLFQSDKPDELQLLQLDTRNGAHFFNSMRFSEGVSFTITGFIAFEGYLFITGSQNGHLRLMHLDPARPILESLPAIYNQASALSDFAADKISRSLDFILTESDRTLGRLQIKRLAPNGDLLSLHFIQYPERNFLSACAAPGDSNKLIIGSYGLRGMSYAQGFFTSILEDQQTPQIRFHDFTTFSHFFDHLNPGRQRRLRNRVSRFAINQKTLRLHQRMLLHSLVQFGDDVLLVGELFYPNYKGEPGNQVFDSFQHVEAVIAAFDKTGNLRWENSFPLHNQRTVELRETVAVCSFNRKVLLAYAVGGKIAYKLLQNSDTTPNDQFLELQHPNGKVYNSETEGLISWYRKHLLVYGTEQMRSRDGTHPFFFLQKLTF